MDKKTNVLYISVDAVRYDFIFHSDKYGLKLPNIHKYFLGKGTYASKGVQGVFPTWTLPSHASMITGVNPSIHKIYNNTYFDPEGKLKGASYWYVVQKVAKTLWDLASENGYTTYNVCWSTSLGANIDYDIPQVNMTETPLDIEFINSMGHPRGLLKEIVKDIGSYTGYNWDGPADVDRTNAACWLLRNKIKQELREKPFFMTMYFAAYDDEAHKTGFLSEASKSALELIDHCIGELVRESYRITDNDIVICLVSDHGMVDNIANIYPNSEFYKAGLIKVDQNNKVVDWDVFAQRAGGVASIHLKDPRNEAVRKRVEECIQTIKDKLKDIVVNILDKDTMCNVRKGMNDADYAVEVRKGFEIREDIKDVLIDDKLAQKAQHGYSEFSDEMKSMFFIIGKDIEVGKDVGSMMLIDIAPTLAKIMGFEMEKAEGKSVL